MMSIPSLITLLGWGAHVLRGMWDLSYPARDQTVSHAMEVKSLELTTKEVPPQIIMEKYFSLILDLFI